LNPRPGASAAPTIGEIRHGLVAGLRRTSDQQRDHREEAVMERQDFGRVLYEKDGPIARVIMNWPEKANSQDSKMVWALDAALKAADSDYEVKVVIIKANGAGFCAGHAMGEGENFPEFTEDLSHTGMHHKSSADLFLWPVMYLWEFRKPTIAQVHGYAIGAGT
jgi:enoyl-CoA hydratase